MPSPLTPEARERLAKAARAATPGPWFHGHGDRAYLGSEALRTVNADDAREVHIAFTSQWADEGGADAAYIAAASPDVVLALLESEARLREALEEIAHRPRVERNPDGDDQAAWSMALIASDALGITFDPVERPA